MKRCQNLEASHNRTRQLSQECELKELLQFGAVGWIVGPVHDQRSYA